jgi:predicted RNase H-like nuclease (RuvC/YqgF family)
MSNIEKEISVAGFSFKLTNKLIVMIVSIAPVVGGALWGTFEFYNDYMSMRSAIKNYVSPDFTEYDKKLALMEESTNKVNDYTRDIKNDLKNEIRALDNEVKAIRSDSRAMQKEARDDVREIRKEVDTKIKRALENPLANKD